MKLRTPEELSDRLDKCISWRKKELIDYKFLSNTYKNSLYLKPITRGGIALAYAHWEGFIKEAAEAYLDYVLIKKVMYKNINLNFVAMAFHDKFKNAKTFEDAYDVVQEVLTKADDTCRINHKKFH